MYLYYMLNVVMYFCYGQFACGINRKVTCAIQAFILYLIEKRGSFFYKFNLPQVLRMNTYKDGPKESE